MTAAPASAIAQRLNAIRPTIPPAVRLIAVSKQMPVEAIRSAYDAGVRDFGESRVQEAEAKQAQLHDLTDITWHLIGHLQSNKAAKALELFDYIHSVDSLKLAQRLDAIAKSLAVKPKILLQVKLRPDPNKFGWDPVELWTDLPVLDTLANLDIQGLMVIAPYGLSDEETLAVFVEVRDLAEKIQQHPWSRLTMRELSMGMSEDYLLAIQAGATMVRLGRTLFAERT